MTKEDKINDLLLTLEEIHAIANEANANSTPSDLRAMLQRIASNAYGALS